MTDPARLPDLRKIDYSDKRPHEFDRLERCAYLYDKIRNVGHPDRLNKSELARKLDVARPTIYNDLNDVVKPYIKGNVGEDHIEVSDSVFQLVIRELLEEGEHDKAAKNIKRWNEWLEDRGVADKEPEEVNIGLADGDDKELLEQIFAE